jgi:ribosomal protein L28
MSKACDVCGRGYLKGNARSHSNIATIKRQHVNIQSMSLNGKRVKACTSCIRTASKEKHVKVKA